MDPSVIGILSFIIALLALGHYSFYLFVEGLLMALLIVLICYLLYKSKPTKESFTVFKENYQKLLTIMMINDIEDDKNQSKSWIKSLFLRTFATYGLKAVMNDPVIFDAGLGMIAYMSVSLPIISIDKSEEKKNIFVFLGVAGAWIPIK